MDSMLAFYHISVAFFTTQVSFTHETFLYYNRSPSIVTFLIFPFFFFFFLPRFIFLLKFNFVFSFVIYIIFSTRRLWIYILYNSLYILDIFSFFLFRYRISALSFTCFVTYASSSISSVWFMFSFIRIFVYTIPCFSHGLRLLCDLWISHYVIYTIYISFRWIYFFLYAFYFLFSLYFLK